MEYTFYLFSMVITDTWALFSSEYGQWNSLRTGPLVLLVPCWVQGKCSLLLKDSSVKFYKVKSNEILGSSIAEKYKIAISHSVE